MDKEKKHSILVVDDEEAIRTLIGKVLSYNGFSAHPAGGYDEALELCKHQKFDVILTDYVMPGKNGLDLIIETNKLYPDTVKILFTGMGGQDLYRDAINRGAIFSLLEKPLNNIQLCETVAKAVEFRSQQLRIQREIRQLQEQYHTIFDYTTDLIQCTDTHGNFIYVNPAWHKTLNYNCEDLTNITLFDLIHKDFRGEIRKIIDRVYAGEMTDAFETIMVSSNGSHVYLEGSATVQLQNEEVLAVNFILRDVTARRRAEKEIQNRLRQETVIARIAHLLANSEEPVFVYPAILEIVGELAKADRVYIYSLNENERMFSCIETWGAQPLWRNSQWEDTVPYSALPNIHEKIKNDDVLVFNNIEDFPEPEKEFMARHKVKSNLIFPIRTSTSVAGLVGFENLETSLNREESELAILKAAVDILANAMTRQAEINYRKQKEHEADQSRLLVIRADRLAALGTMTAGIIHEITQPLNAINVSTQTILYGMSRGWEFDNNKVRNSLDLIVDQIKRINEIISNMRAFSRDGLPAVREKANLNTLVQRVLTLHSEQMKAHGIEVEYYPGDVPDYEMNTQQVLQVILNLASNAYQSLDESENSNKKITVSTSASKEYILLEVSDNGQGVPQDILGKIFDPFFTTKEVGKGTGLGLSISSGIVNDHNGVLDVRNNESGGATFVMRLPLQ